MRVYLNIGSNLGDKRDNLMRAAQRIGEVLGGNVVMSSFVESEPWGFESANSFVNVGVRIDVEGLTPEALLNALQSIEKEMGSENHRNADGSYRDRLVDIDIMDIEGIEIDTPRLTIPHKHLYDRDFFLIPYKELAANR